MSEDYYRGYLLIRLSKIGAEANLTDKMMALHDENGNWDVTFATPIFGAWDMIVEISFKTLEDLDTVITFLRADESIRNNIEETSTLVSSKPNYLKTQDKYNTGK